MAEMNRRKFLKAVMSGSAALGLAAIDLPGPVLAAAGQRVDLGQGGSLQVTCVSEPTVKDSGVFLGDMWQNGGPGGCDPWETPWTPDNGAGFCSLFELDGLDGKSKKIILDTGWNPKYIARQLESTGVDRLLRRGEIDCLVISHEHPDHFWGLEAILRLAPELTIVIPSTFSPRAMRFLAGHSFKKANAINRVKHQGRLVITKPGKAAKLFPGVGVVLFDVPLIFKARGEQSLIFNLKDKGLVLASGCCHQTIITFIEHARKNVRGGERIHGLYGGLHLSPFGEMGSLQEQWIHGLARYRIDKLGCNHCTGLLALKLMKKLGYPLVGGKEGQGGLCPGNGDKVSFG